MAKGPKLNKFKSVLKKLNSFGNHRLSRQNNAVSPTAAAAIAAAASDDESNNSTTYRSDSFEDLRPVYVGKSRRRYLVGPEVVHHPLFLELVERSGGHSEDDSSSIHVVACEVVLFEHLLWMLENADESMDGQLVDFYAC
ncbi:auxin-responsive protein SAUR76-like [Punica granatum]|uniref:Uncharacterized protein n=2 Tax=Punica granatum TaxID=22663 RepID=A0A218WP11_PUNGR|nr:auxin-responsive protein SAUR76-like [Punica granatum]OWM74353.1 hypothetical protein CDL15_Pgr013257 [Punica granatum]PKI71607.1 hypothetical protein CRG98_008015 [Punica granatum]